MNLASPGPIGGTTPDVISATTLNLLSGNLAGALLQETPTNSSLVPNGNKEVVVKNNSGAGANVIALRNTDATGYSAMTARDYLGNEKFATGYGNPSETAGVFASTNFIQSWGSTTPPMYQVTMDGDYGNTGSGFRFYRHATHEWNAGAEASGAIQFTIWHHIPWGTTQRRAFLVEANGNVQNFCKIIQNATDSTIQFWKDVTPSKAIAFGLNIPGNAPGNDSVVSSYTGSAWVQNARLFNGGGVAIGAGVTDPGVGNLQIGGVILVKSGTNSRAGTFTLVAGAATVANTAVTANSVVLVTLKTAGGTRAGIPDIVPTASTGFVATAVGTDTSTYNFVILEVG